jgi:exo-beta-1,3-glucanase (GH17 family)
MNSKSPSSSSLRVLLLLLLIVIGTIVQLNHAAPIDTLLSHMTVTQTNPGCVAFNPYVDGYDEHNGPHPSKELIDKLMDNLLDQTPFRCIQIYKLVNGMTDIIASAYERGVKVITILYITGQDPDPEFNNKIIDKGIEMNEKFPGTIIAYSCGSEFRLREGKEVAQPIIIDCVNRLKAAGITQPITSNEIAVNMCNLNYNPCNPWSEVIDKLDFLSLNIFPWWGNKYNGACIPAKDAANSQFWEFNQFRQWFPNKPITISEYGWPAGPNGFAHFNQNIGRTCTGMATEQNQDYFVKSNWKILRDNNVPATLFEAYREPWKVGKESQEAGTWGICEATPPYECKDLWNMPTPVPDSNCSNPCGQECYTKDFYTCTNNDLRIKNRDAFINRQPIPMPSLNPNPVPEATTPEPIQTLEPSIVESSLADSLPLEPSPSPTFSPSPSPSPEPRISSIGGEESSSISIHYQSVFSVLLFIVTVCTYML